MKLKHNLNMTTKTLGAYHYRTPRRMDGTTRCSEKAALEHLHKVGKICKVRLYLVKSRPGDREGRYRVMVYGDKGTAHHQDFIQELEAIIDGENERQDKADAK